VLALDSATEACSAALLDGATVRVRLEVLGRGHAERLLPMVDELLREAGVPMDALDAIAFGRGPGAFTGVRIAVSVAQGLSLGSGLRLVPVSDLWALAAAALERTPGAGHALACLDARMGEVYWGLAQRDPDGRCRLLGEGLAAPVAVPAPPSDSTLVLAGHGFSAYPAIAARLGADALASWRELLPDAATIARLAVGELEAGRSVSALEAQPVYLRDDVAGRASTTPATTQDGAQWPGNRPNH
jgi:tRNA threonylcarbamoyladenosine biosynthesis protein TsaB